MPTARTKHKQQEEITGPNPECKLCPLHSTSVSDGKKLVCLWGSGNNNADIMLVGEAPGKEEITKESPFIGEAGKVLTRYLNEAGLDRESLWITNAVKCRPPKNRTPLAKETKGCAPYLDYEINKVKPKVIGLLGAVALKRVLGLSGITKHRGEAFWSETYNCWCVPTWHPAYLVRNSDDLDTSQQLLRDLKYIKSVAETGKTGKGKTKVEIADTKEKADLLIKELETKKVVSVDTETKGTFINGDITMVSFSWKSGEAWVLPFYRTYPDEVCIVCDGKKKIKLEKNKPMQKCEECGGQGKFSFEPTKFWDEKTDSDLWARLKPILESTEIKKVGQNLKYDYKFFRCQKNIVLDGVIFDTLLAHYLLDENAKGQHSLDKLALKFTNMGHYTYGLYQVLNIKEEKDIDENTYSHAPFEPLCQYAGEDADCAFRLLCVLFKEIKRQGLKTLLVKLMIPLSFVLAEMEIEGIEVDKDYYLKLSEKYRKKLEETEAELNSFGEVKLLERTQKKPVNFNSSQQLGTLFYDILKLPIYKKTETDKASTDKTVLIKLANDHPIPKLILEHRKLSKFKSTYIDPMPDLIEEDGRVHTTYTLDVTTTGRTSSRKPNLQNIPKREPEKAKEVRNGIVARKNCRFIESDFKQIEFRHLIDMSGDKQGIEDIKNKRDIHKLVASAGFGIKYEDVTEEIRDKAKTIVYSVIYGKSKENLAKETGLTVGQVEKVFGALFSRYPKVKPLMENYIRTAETVGEVKNWIGRKRRLVNGFKSSNEVARAEAERQAVNSPIQGGASDILSVATIRMFRRLKQEKLKSKLVLTIHDSLVLEVYDDEFELVKGLIKEEMERPINGLSPIMEVDMAVGHRLGDMEKLQLQ